MYKWDKYKGEKTQQKTKICNEWQIKACREFECFVHEGNMNENPLTGSLNAIGIGGENIYCAEKKPFTAVILSRNFDQL